MCKDEFIVGEEVPVHNVQSKKLEIVWQLHQNTKFYFVHEQ